MNEPRVVCTASDIGETWAGIPGIEVTPNGRVFVVWFSGGEREPDPQNRAYLVSSEDGGDTFSPPLVMAEPRDGSRAFDPTLWIAPNRALWLIYNRSNRTNAKHAVVARVCNRPDALETVWSDELPIGFDVPFCFRLNKPTVLSSGEWVMPVTHAPNLTWTLHGAVEAPEWALENMIVERADTRDRISYPDAAWSRDGTVHAVYDRDRGGAGAILLVRFRVSR